MADAQDTVDSKPNPEPDERSLFGCGVCGSGRAGASGHAETEGVNSATAVRFGYMRYIGEFVHGPDLRFTCGAKVIIQTKRGIELGEQVPLMCAGCDRSIPRDRVREWVGRCGEDSFIFDAGRLLREATAGDLAEYAHIQSGCRDKRDFAQQIADRHGLPLRVVDCECPFGGERIIFFFTAAERVDFRGLVKDLAREYRTRIEMRQIGARDEARLLADFETCGREVCCKTFLKSLRPISMRMAKLQKATLDPSQVSGRCGRLKCCLRYEQVGYEDLDRRLPRVGVRIRTDDDEGVVTKRQVLTQLLQIRTQDDKVVTVSAEDIIVGDASEPRTSVRAESTSAERGKEGPCPPADSPKSAGTGVGETGRLPSRRGRGQGRRERPEPEKDGSEASSQAEPAAEGTEQSADRPIRRRRRRGRRRRRQGGGDGEGGARDAPPEKA